MSESVASCRALPDQPLLGGRFGYSLVFLVRGRRKGEEECEA